MEKINDIPKRKVPINVMVEAKIGKPLIATITDNVNNITQSLGMVEKSKKCPVRIEEIVDRFSKVNDTIFRIVDINVNADKDIFIPVKVMNDLRRDVLLKLENHGIQYQMSIGRTEKQTKLAVDIMELFVK